MDEAKEEGRKQTLLWIVFTLQVVNVLEECSQQRGGNEMYVALAEVSPWNNYILNFLCA